MELLGKRRIRDKATKPLCTCEPAFIRNMPQLCGSCEIADVKSNSQKAVDACQARVINLQAQLSSLKHIHHGSQEVTQLKMDLEEAEKAFETRSMDKFLMENALIGKVPELFEGKPMRRPKLLHRSRTQSILRQEVQEEEIVEDEDGEVGQGDCFEELPTPVFDRGPEGPFVWTPQESDLAYPPDTNWTNSFFDTENDWYAELDGDDVYKTRSFLSPVEEMTESEPDFNTPRLHALTLNAAELIQRPPSTPPESIPPKLQDTTDSPELASELPPSTSRKTHSPTSAPSFSSTPSPERISHDSSPPTSTSDLAFPSPDKKIKDLASTLYIPSGLVPPLQLIPAFSFEQLRDTNSTPTKDRAGTGQILWTRERKWGLPSPPASPSPSSKHEVKGSTERKSGLPEHVREDGMGSPGKRENDRPTDGKAQQKDSRGPHRGRREDEPKSDYHGIRYWNWQKSGTAEH
ncbi:hypothetical protein K461DRAFT_323092 [Myriangium duriaei CBS 260.36]|uniref:Uncharacterized protein n=1 Tax=Myriangium duriaei CBS 260.36 TaxID=1168546 RepID=A0A9P4MF11_9PEZI|nr:hypothetical protein K461DRAFT_323092 [Myriangium duriaei CBS 260.36]